MKYQIDQSIKKWMKGNRRSDEAVILVSAIGRWAFGPSERRERRTSSWLVQDLGFWSRFKTPSLPSLLPELQRRRARMTAGRIAIILSGLFIAFLGIIIFRNQIGTFFSSDPGNDPVAYWKFDEGVGSTANDSSTNENDGTLGTGSSAPTWITEDQCVSGKCLQFDGTNDYLSVTDSSLLGQTGPMTVSVWVKFYSNQNTYFIHKWG